MKLILQLVLLTSALIEALSYLPCRKGWSLASTIFPNGEYLLGY